MNKVPPWQDAPTLCANICISPCTLDNWVQQGLLPPPKKVGGKRLWKWVDVERHLEGTGVDPLAERVHNATKNALASG